MNEEELNEKKLRNDIIFKSVLALVITTAFVAFIFILLTKSVQCNSNPMVYGAEQLSEKYDAPIACSCNLKTFPPSIFEFTEEGVKNEEEGFNFTY